MLRGVSQVTTALFETLQRRPRPEDVAELVREAIGASLTPTESSLLSRVASHSLRQGLFQISSMAADFQRPVAPARQVSKACELFREVGVVPLSVAECADVARVYAFIERLSGAIGKAPGLSSYKADRLNRAARKSQGLDHSRRRYNKLFRFLRRFEDKVASLHAQGTT